MVGRAILSPLQVERVLHRIALEIRERHLEEPEVALLAASARGVPLAQHLAKLLQAEGAHPFLLQEAAEAHKPSLLLVDDVLYTGRTLLNRLSEVWRLHPLRQIEVAVLVDRGHRSFPIAADYVGVRLATTLQQYVEVRPAPHGWEVWLV